MPFALGKACRPNGQGTVLGAHFFNELDTNKKVLSEAKEAHNVQKTDTVLVMRQELLVSICRILADSWPIVFS